MGTLTRISLILNLCRGGKSGYTVCEEEWERRLDGDRLARINVIVLDFLFHHWKNEKHHCRNHWKNRKFK